MLLPLAVLFIVVPLLELAIILQVGRAIGPWWTIGLLIADSILGAVLLRSQGRAAWRRFTAAIRGGRPPATEVLDGALLIAGGALLLTPGFLTDGLGLLLLVPPTRALVRRLLARRLLKRMVSGMAAPRPFGPRGANRPGYDLDGSATESDRPRPSD